MNQPTIVATSKVKTPRDLRFWWIMGLPILSILLFFVIPLLITMSYSLKSGTLASGFVWSFDTLRTFIANSSYHRLLGESTWVALLTSVFCILLSYPIAYQLVFNMEEERRLTLMTLIVIPAWTSYLLRILAWKLLLGSNGLFNTLFMWLGIIQEPSPILLFSRGAVIVTLVYVWLPFVVLPIYATLERIDRRLIEASADLGASPVQTFMRVTLPLSLPGVLAGFLSVFIPTLGEYITPLLVGGVNGIMYGNIINDQFARALNWPMGAVMSLVLLIFLAPLFVVFIRTQGTGSGIGR